MHANNPRVAPSSPARRVSYADAAPEESSLLAPSFGPQRKTHGLPPQEREKSVAHDVVARSRQVDLEAHLPGLSRQRSGSISHSSGSSSVQEPEPVQRRSPLRIAAALGAKSRVRAKGGGEKLAGRRVSNVLKIEKFTFRQGTIGGVERRDRTSSSKRDSQGSALTFLETVRASLPPLPSHPPPARRRRREPPVLGSNKL